MYREKVEAQQTRLLGMINALLGQNLNPEEGVILAAAKKRLEKSAYLPSVVGDLRAGLTPLAIKRALSKDVGNLYLMINNDEFAHKGFGGGLGFIFAGMFR
ncbi:bacteriocin immunity protein [uncultured Secundilactobacillus sp.]|uniref:bacteriocin immunity protein n=1 Tax=uncultured Secundilactobacillus sp. TaxID=2813935 RepID=UPI00258D9E21|nr:bacteriocin immunity protein [uncultured Secundilactobacillus sp.]